MFQQPFTGAPRQLVIPVTVYDAVHDPSKSVKEDVQALLDTGANFCVIPLGLAETLKLQVTGFVTVTIADGRQLRDQPVVDCRVLVGDVGPIYVSAVVFNVPLFFLGMIWFNEVNSSYSRHNRGRLLKIEPQVDGSWIRRILASFIRKLTANR